MMIYGSSWANKFGTEEIENIAHEEWNRTLMPFDEEIIYAAIEETKVIYKSFPPTPGEFYEICCKIKKSKKFYASISDGKQFNNDEKKTESTKYIKSWNEICLTLGRPDRVKME